MDNFRNAPVATGRDVESTPENSTLNVEIDSQRSTVTPRRNPKRLCVKRLSFCESELEDSDDDFILPTIKHEEKKFPTKFCQLSHNRRKSNSRNTKDSLEIKMSSKTCTKKMFGKFWETYDPDNDVFVHDQMTHNFHAGKLQCNINNCIKKSGLPIYKITRENANERTTHLRTSQYGGRKTVRVHTENAKAANRKSDAKKTSLQSNSVYAPLHPTVEVPSYHTKHLSEDEIRNLVHTRLLILRITERKEAYDAQQSVQNIYMKKLSTPHASDWVGYVHSSEHFIDHSKTTNILNTRSSSQDNKYTERCIVPFAIGSPGQDNSLGQLIERNKAANTLTVKTRLLDHKNTEKGILLPFEFSEYELSHEQFIVENTFLNALTEKTKSQGMKNTGKHFKSLSICPPENCDFHARTASNNANLHVIGEIEDVSVAGNVKPHANVREENVNLCTNSTGENVNLNVVDTEENVETHESGVGENVYLELNHSVEINSHANNVAGSTNMPNTVDTPNSSTLQSGTPLGVVLAPSQRNGILSDVVAFVDVISHEDEDISVVVTKELLKLGAFVVLTFTKRDPVTVILFHDGRVSTYKKAKKREIPLVSVLWIEECRRIGTIAPYADFPPSRMERYECPETVKLLKKRKFIYSERSLPRKQRKRKTTLPTVAVTPSSGYQCPVESTPSFSLRGPNWLNDIPGTNNRIRILVSMTNISEQEFREMLREPKESKKYECSPLGIRLLYQHTKGMTESCTVTSSSVSNDCFGNTSQETNFVSDTPLIKELINESEENKSSGMSLDDMKAVNTENEENVSELGKKYHKVRRRSTRIRRKLTYSEVEK